MTDQTKPSAAKPPRTRRFARPLAEDAVPPVLASAADLAPPSPEPKRTKASAVVALLQRPGGATLAELVAATGWLPHTARAHLTGLRKKGHVLEKTKRGDTTCYRIAEAG